MNWQTEKLIEEAKKVISDEGIFSFDQIHALRDFADLIAKAIGKESDCNKPNHNF